jgi:hypothetical protein
MTNHEPNVLRLRIVGNIVKDAEYDKDGESHYIRFIDDSILVLWNEVLYTDNFSVYFNLKVVDFFITDEVLQLSFSDTCNIKMTMRVEDYNGPEAFMFRSADS